jgi:hypothetical protein
MKDVADYFVVSRMYFTLIKYSPVHVRNERRNISEGVKLVVA